METARIGNMEVTDLRRSLPRAGLWSTRELRMIRYIVVHHSGPPVHRDLTASEMARYHIDRNRWPGIAYHLVAHWDGRVEYTADISWITFHVGVRNAECVAICLTGDWSAGRIPSKTQTDAAREAIANLQYALGWWVPVLGHGDIGQSQCPGSEWEQWRDRVSVRPESADAAALRERIRMAREVARQLDGILAE